MTSFYSLTVWWVLMIAGWALYAVGYWVRDFRFTALAALVFGLAIVNVVGRWRIDRRKRN